MPRIDPLERKKYYEERIKLPGEREKRRAGSKKHWDRDGRNANYRQTHGITAAEFDARVAAQNNKCPIGNHEFGPIGRLLGTSPALDHDHMTGKHRGILCRTHNLALGGFHDSVEELEAAAAYLKRHQGE
jgi:Recombination endonuclease VII